MINSLIMVFQQYLFVITFVIICSKIVSLEIPKADNGLKPVLNDTRRPEYYFYKLGEQSSWVDRDERVERNGDHLVEIFVNTVKETQQLTLDSYFMFYGHLVNTVHISRKGFIHMDHISTNEKTPLYISPLTANFYLTTNQPPSSGIFYLKNATVLIVWWENLRHDFEDEVSLFTFQVIYHISGAILFNYIRKLDGHQMDLLTEFPPRIGLADAPYMSQDHSVAVESYHTLNIPVNALLHHSSIVFIPLPSCMTQDTCELCTTFNHRVHNDLKGLLTCYWCPSLNLCSDGADKLAHHWKENHCSVDAFKEVDKCAQHNNHEQQHQRQQQRRKHQQQLQHQQNRQLEHIGSDHRKDIDIENKEKLFEDLKRLDKYYGYEDQYEAPGNNYSDYNYSDDYNYTYYYGDDKQGNNTAKKKRSGKQFKQKFLSVLITVLTVIFKGLILTCFILLVFLNLALLWACIVLHLPESSLSTYLKRRFSFLTEFFKNRGMIRFRTLSESSAVEGDIQMQLIRPRPPLLPQQPPKPPKPLLQPPRSLLPRPQSPQQVQLSTATTTATFKAV